MLEVVSTILVLLMPLLAVFAVAVYLIVWWRERKLSPEEKARRYGMDKKQVKQARNWRYAYGFMMFAYLFVLGFIVVSSWQGARERHDQQFESPEVSETKQESAAPIDTSDWKIYRSGYLGFEIKYPKGLFFNIHNDTETFNVISISNNDILIGITASPRFSRSLQEISEGGYDLTQDPQFAPYLGTRIIRDTTETTIDGEQALVRTTRWGPPVPPDFPPEPVGYEGDVIWAMEEMIEQDTFVVHKESQYRISVDFHGGNIEQQRELYSQILSTFRFIEPDDALPVDSSRILTMFTKIPNNYKTFSDRYIDLHSLDLTTGESERLIRWQGCEASVILSPNKARLSYWVKTNQRCEAEYTQGGDIGRVDLWIADLSRYDKRFFSNRTIARNIWKFTNPKWSSNGYLIAYDRVVEHPSPREREHQLYVYNLQSEKEEFIGSFFGAAHQIVGFSSNDEYIYYNDHEFLYKVNLRTKAQERISAREFGFSSGFILSPDKRKIVVFKSEDWYGGKTTPFVTKIGVIDTSTNKYRELYSGTEHSLTLYSSISGEKGPTFLPDNSRVVYGAAAGQQGNETSLWILDTATGERRLLEGTLSSTIHGITPIALSGDGKLVLYSGWMSETTYYYTLILSTGEVKKIENTQTATMRSGKRFLDWLN